jgi:hypothetical protein
MQSVCVKAARSNWITLRQVHALAYLRRHIFDIFRRFPHFEQLQKFKTINFLKILTYLICYLSKIFSPTEILQCDFSKLPKFLFSWRCSKFGKNCFLILPLNFQIMSAKLKISLSSWTSLLFRCSYFQNFFLSDTDKCFMFSKIFWIF